MNQRVITASTIVSSPWALTIAARSSHCCGSPKRADVQASTQTVYVLGHNITNCQGLQDFGRFLVVSGIDRERGAKYLDEAADKLVGAGGRA